MKSVLSSPAYVIHLARAVERRQDFMTNISNAGFTDISIFDAIDGTNLDRVIECKQILGNNAIFDWEICAGQIGCLLSHLMIWKHIIDNNIPLATVFEDDVHFHPQWKELSEEYWNETPKDFDILFIGNSLESCVLNTPSNKINTESTYCTHAYIITNNGAKHMLNAILNWGYKDFCHATRGNTLTGLYPIDIMIKDTQKKVLSGEIPPLFKWFCWNGTHYPCDFNRLPVKGNDYRNTGLVFQNTDTQLISYVTTTMCKKNVFMDKNGNEVNITTYENTEQWIAETFIEEDAIVLELGGRYGVVSSVINKKLKNKKNHVVVEPDPAIFKILQRNLLLNDADPICYNGTITQGPQYIELLDEGTNTRYQPCACDSVIVHHKNLRDLIEETGLQFDTLVADCEGCLGVFFDENLEYIPNFKMITMEYDYSSEIDYDKINKILIDFGFIQVRPGGHSVWKKPSSEISHKTYNPISQIETNPPVVTRQKLIWNRNSFNLKYIN